ncbi:3-mercaptopyruvate sulfurtransferase [soil metagenome]
MPSSFAKPDLLASTAWLAENHKRPSVRVLDCRWRVDGSGRREHAEGHIPGSVYIDWATDLVDAEDSLPYQLAKPAAFAAAMLAVGVGDGMTVIVLDDTYSLYAARVWWSLQAYGIGAVRILDGGWPAWLESGEPISTSATQIEPVAFSPNEIASRRVGAEEVREQLRSGSAQVIDARTPAEYLGQGGPGPRRGHIAGALNVPAALLVGENSQAILAASSLNGLLGRAGVTRNHPLITYDSAGVGASKLAFCLELAGHAEVAVYDAGWADWAARDPEDYPVDS